MRKDLSIESLRGLAAILMVAGHVIGSDAARGMAVGDDSGWRLFYVLLEDIRMPLFAALSGFVYAFRPVTDGGGYGSMMWGKVRRLLVPLVTVGTLFVLLQSVIPGANADGGELWRLYVYGVGHFWFLQAIFLVFLIVGLLDLIGALGRTVWWALITTAAIALSVVVSGPQAWDVFSFSEALWLLPFFLLGYGTHRHVANPPPWFLPVTAAVAFVGVYAVRVFVVADVVALDTSLLRIDRVLIGFSAVALLLLARDRIRVPALAWLGPFAFAIYLLHVFGSAAARIGLELLGIHNEWIVFFVCMLAALALPILFETTLGRISWVSWTFLGQRPYRPRRGRFTSGVEASAQSTRLPDMLRSRR